MSEVVYLGCRWEQTTGFNAETNTWEVETCTQMARVLALTNALAADGPEPEPIIEALPLCTEHGTPYAETLARNHEATEFLFIAIPALGVGGLR